MLGKYPTTLDDKRHVPTEMPIQSSVQPEPGLRVHRIWVLSVPAAWTIPCG